MAVLSRRDLLRRCSAEALESRLFLSTYYVATTGVDANAGNSLQAPFRTVQRAAQVAQPGDTVLIRGGTYRETVKPARSGTSSARITFQPYGGESVTISGSDVVSGWSKHSGSIYKAYQSWDLGLGDNQIFLDGQMMIEARWPNTTLDITRPTKATIDKVSSSTIKDAALTQPAGTWDGATIHFMPGQEWVGQTGTVTKSSAGSLNIAYTSMGDDARLEANDRYYLTGKFVALDSPGEWFRDPSSGQLYFWTPQSDSPANHLVEARRRDWAFDLRGLSHIDVRGLNFFSAGLITNSASDGIRLIGLNVKYASHFTQMPSGWDRGNDTGISLQGDNDLIADSTVAYSAGHGVVLAGNNSRVENSIVYGAAYNAGDDAGIRTIGSGHAVIGNTVYDAGRCGIKISNTTRVKVLNNLIHDVMLQTTDGGGIYTYGIDGTGSEIGYNKIYNVNTGGWGGVGVFLDNGSSNFLVDHNVVYNVNHALKMNPASRGNLVYNNTLDGSSTSVDSNRGRDMIGSVFANNIFTKATNIGVTARQINNLSAGADAKFANRARGDYSLLPNSPAIDRGVNLSTITAGFLGRSPDLGALEYGKTAFAAGARLDAPSMPPPTPDPTPRPPIGPPPPSHRLDARDRIEAEKFDATNGVIAANYSIGYAEGGDWIKFGQVDFGAGVGSFQTSIALANAYAGKQIEVRVGSPMGLLAGTLTTRGTGGWNRYATQSTTIRTLSGVQDLYIVFRNSTSGVANMDWIRFV